MQPALFVLTSVIFHSCVSIEIQSRGLNGQRQNNEDYPFLVKIIVHFRERGLNGEVFPANGCPTVAGADPHDEIFNPNGAPNTTPSSIGEPSAEEEAPEMGFGSVPQGAANPGSVPKLKEVVDRYRKNRKPASTSSDSAPSRRVRSSFHQHSSDSGLRGRLISSVPESLPQSTFTQGDDQRRFVNTGRTLFFPCTGTIISPNFILTAGHCTRNIKQGTYYSVQVPWGDSLRARVAVVHPKCQIIKSGWAVNDIALLKLDTCVPSKYVVPLAPQSYSIDNTRDEVFYVGYGKTQRGNSGPTSSEKPTLITLSTYPKKECEKTHYTVDLKDVICATPSNGLVLAGDSGGPLLTCSSGAMGVSAGNMTSCSQLGVLSWSYTEVTGHSNTTLFMNTYQAHKTWIDAVIRAQTDLKCLQ